MSEGRIPELIRKRVRAGADNPCGYCHSPQRLVLGLLEIEHIVPRARGGTDDEENLWLACQLCNNFKGIQMDGLDPETGIRVTLFNPRRQRWLDHFNWSQDGTRILGRSQVGRATVLALQLNHFIAVMVRTEWLAAGWHPPEQDRFPR